MSARVLVVDDILPNVKLLEAKLKNAYFEVLTALNGQDALEIAAAESPDIILLDIMMPGMDGFEVCERLKADPKTEHIPVVMVTALTDATDRVRGLEAGADDFLSKPVNDTALMARVKSLVRLKMTVDEWRIRENTANHLGVFDGPSKQQAQSVQGAKVLVVEDKAFESDKFIETLKRDDDIVIPAVNSDQAIASAQEHEFDIITISLNMEHEDGLRLVSLLRSNDRTRSIPILMVGLMDEDMPRIAQGLELGAHDYILRPVDRNELLARVRTQIRRKRYQERLRANYEQSLNMALTDTLTGLYNRRYLEAHFGKIIANIEETRKPIGVLMMDIDHFKSFNDTYGHNVGDEVLKTFADRIKERLRSFDLVARQGGEEFVAVLPNIKPKVAMRVAERLRKSICDEPIVCSAPEGTVTVSVSIGGVTIDDPNVSVENLLKRADDCLYEAKEQGRNCVIFEGFGLVTPEKYMSEEELAEYQTQESTNSEIQAAAPPMEQTAQTAQTTDSDTPVAPPIATSHPDEGSIPDTNIPAAQEGQPPIPVDGMAPLLPSTPSSSAPTPVPEPTPAAVVPPAPEANFDPYATENSAIPSNETPEMENSVTPEKAPEQKLELEDDSSAQTSTDSKFF